MPSIDHLLSRADDESLQHLLGRPAVRLLNLLDREMARPSALRRTVSELRTPKELLLTSSSRSVLLNLLTEDQASELTRMLGLEVSGTVFETLLLCGFSKQSEKRSLFEYFDVLEFEGVGADEIRDVGFADFVTPAYGLFEHQKLAAARATAQLHSGNRRVVLHMPTGSGKTRTAMHIIADHLRTESTGLVLWLASSEELCEQAAKEFEVAWSHLGNIEVSLHRLWGNHEFGDTGPLGGFMVAGLQKLYSAVKSKGSYILNLADRTSLVIMDEAHQAVAPTYRDLLELVVDRKESTMLLGLTATPGRTWNDPTEDERLSDFFSKKKVTLDIPGYENPIDYLIDQEYLAKPLFESLEVESSRSLLDQTSDLDGLVEIPETILRELGDDEQRNLVILNKVETLAREHQRVIVFAPSVASARLLATVLRARGSDAAVVTGETPTYERVRIIDRFRGNAKGAMILCNYGVLTTGFDAPRTSAAVIARPTKSLVLYSQMVGRATRGRRAGGNQTASIVTVVDTALPGFGEMSAAFTNWEDIWE